mgnify:CR=1 FL=1
MCYFRMPEEDLKSLIDFLEREHMSDGGFNCRSNRSGAVHSSMHSTISVLEGLYEYLRNSYTYKKASVKRMIESSNRFCWSTGFTNLINQAKL